MAAPMPRVPPVTRALLPARSFASGSAGPASRLTGGVLMAWLLSVSAETRIGSALEGESSTPQEINYPLGDSPAQPGRAGPRTMSSLGPLRLHLRESARD